MKYSTARSKRVASTLIELIASMVAAAALLGGIGSTLFIALRASNPNYTPAVAVLEAAGCVSDICNDLQFATALTEATATAITVVVPDRPGDGDTVNETIRFAWAGTGQPVTRQYNGAAATAVLATAQSVSIAYYPSSAAPKYVTVRVQRRSDSRTTVETSCPLLNL